MTREILDPLPWLDLAEQAGFQVEWHISYLPPKEYLTPRETQRLNQLIFLVDDDGSLPMEVTTQAAQILRKAPGTFEVESYHLAIPKKRKFVANNVEPGFFQVVKDLIDERSKRVTKHQQLNQLFDQKVEEELAADPELTELESQIAHLQTVQAGLIKQKKDQREPTREGFVFVADEEAFERTL